MKRASPSRSKSSRRVLILGAGSFAHSHGTILRECGAEALVLLTRPMGRYPASLAGPVFEPERDGSWEKAIREADPDWILPMSIDWMRRPEAGILLERGIFAPSLEGMRLERDRDFARRLCRRCGVPAPRAYVARNRIEAERLLERRPIAWVIKNPLCSPESPVHTIVCRSPEETAAWLPHLDFAEGVFLQEYMGADEAGHIALISAGQVWPLATNREYKRSFAADLGPLAGVPLGGTVEADPEDRYGLARALIRPLLPWFRETGFHGPVQATAARRGGKWCLLEYNVRLGVTSGPLILRMLENPLAVLEACVRDRPPPIRFRKEARAGVSAALVGYGFPYPEVKTPAFPVRLLGEPLCDVWWNEVRPDPSGRLTAEGQRLAEVCAIGPSAATARGKVYGTLSRIEVPGSYYRPDIGLDRGPLEEDRERGDCGNEE